MYITNPNMTLPIHQYKLQLDKNTLTLFNITPIYFDVFISVRSGMFVEEP